MVGRSEAQEFCVKAAGDSSRRINDPMCPGHPLNENPQKAYTGHLINKSYLVLCFSHDVFFFFYIVLYSSHQNFRKCGKDGATEREALISHEW